MRMREEKNLRQLRQEIEAVDHQLLALWQRRLQIAKQIGVYKKQRNLPVHDPEREAAHWQNWLDLAQPQGAAEQLPLADWFQALLYASKAVQGEPCRAGHIYLIGLPGSGKSTVGAVLAEQLGRPFADLDVLIAGIGGHRITEIFAEEGETAFRNLETAVLRLLAHHSREMVIACGGGTILREENRSLLKHSGRVVLLQRDLQQCAQALAAGDRPLAANLADLEQLWQNRQGRYMAAADDQFINDGPVEQVAAALAARLSQSEGEI